MGEPLAGLAPIETAQEATQEALQVIKEIPKNLVLGAELVCPCGSSHSYLNLETEEIEIGNLPQATVKDCRPKDNIQPFGTCWQGFFSIPHSCEKMMDLAEEWENPEPQTMLLNGEEVITTKSTLVCYASGREIYAVSSGQGGDNRFAKQQKLYLDVEKDYPGLLARLTDPHGSLYLEGGKYREAIGFLKDYLDERGGEVFLPGIYDMKEPEDVLVVAILDRLLTDCDASSYERLISGLENTGAQTGMYDKQGWDVYTLNQKMLYMLSIDSQATAEKMETSSFARWVEGHKKFMGILGDVVTEVAYGAVLYRCQTAKAVSKSKGEGGLDTIIKNGKVSIDDIKTNPSAFSGKSAEEIADVLRNSGYDVTIKNSTRSRSGAQIIQINNPGGGKNISQVQVSLGGGRHGSNPYVKISTTDQGIIKIVDGIESTYKTDGKETATIIFSGGN